MPDSSVMSSFAILPGVDATSVPVHADSSTADAGADGPFVVVGVIAGDVFDAA
jgi:hypothetical protein